MLGALLMALSVAGASAGEDRLATAERYARWGDETLGAIRRDFWLPEQRLFAERTASKDEKRRQPAFMWGCGVQLSALAAAARYDAERYAQPLADFAAALDAYWTQHGGTGGYDVQPNPRASDRYYDDNAWIVLALVEAFEVTGERKYLERAIETQRFVMSGEDEKLGGGLYWRENARESKNTCANAPGIVGALLLYRHTREAAQLDSARRLYAWTCEKLQDPADGLFWDAVRIDGSLDRRKFTYNTAVMIRANGLLFEITGEPRHRAEAERVARAAIEHWMSAETGAVRDAGHFAHMLLESLLYVARLTGDGAMRERVGRSVVYLHTALRDADDRYPNRWHETDRPRRAGFSLLDQASVARMYFAAACDARDAEPAAIPREPAGP